MMSVVLTFMVWNFSPDLNNIDSTDSKKSNTKTIGKPMSANIENVISPYQIVEVKGDKVKGLAPSRAQLSQVTGTLKNHEVSKVEHIHRDYNLNIPMLNDHFYCARFSLMICR